MPDNTVGHRFESKNIKLNLLNGDIKIKNTLIVTV